MMQDRKTLDPSIHLSIPTDLHLGRIERSPLRIPEFPTMMQDAGIFSEESPMI